MLQLQAIESGYGESPVLRNVTMRVDQAQVVCLIGRNGVGKTTLMRTLTGQLKIRHGTMSLDEVDVTTWDSVYRARSGIGYVPQGREIFPLLTVKENLLLGLEPCNPQPKTFPEDVIELFPVLPQMYHRQGGDLSGGQQQQLAFARALASRPKLLLLDEPTEGIQPSIVEEIRNVICKIKAQGNTSVILVEQSIDFVRSVADYIYVMDKGSIVAQGDPEHIDIEQFEHYLTV
ncbi:urea ABC transporter ATP-binding protein [Fontibacillus panacisegetis]|uniref:Urea ABC transporter ATP-binding protein n=1 Tax=Fontibacillus panacisegetis TaxID=670482 RepID=A0A1G7UA21_9BACL|nr:urea ABC transporter ATP-binding subunit UrtE [Fontibacillus panacisegetis]SDG44455.1 urea ABC transporter ATP-binding protein [Fontibacillus panacisegetis]